MELTCVFDFQGREKTAACITPSEPSQTDADYLIANWIDPSQEPTLTVLAAHWGPHLLVPDVWQQLLPQAGLLISSAISGGELQQRFQEAPPRRCWLLEEPLCMVFPLPCLTGQGTPISTVPDSAGFYSPSLGCCYIHQPGRAILFDTDKTMARKRQLAKECGFLGYLRLSERAKTPAVK